MSTVLNQTQIDDLLNKLLNQAIKPSVKAKPPVSQAPTSKSPPKPPTPVKAYTTKTNYPKDTFVCGSCKLEMSIHSFFQSKKPIKYFAQCSGCDYTCFVT